MRIEPYEELPEAPPPDSNCAHESSYRQAGVVWGKGYCTLHTCRCGARWCVWHTRSERAG